MRSKRKWTAWAVVVVLCVAAVTSVSFAADVRVRLAPPEHVDAWMGATARVVLPWRSGWEPPAGTDFSDWTVQTTRADGPAIIWSQVDGDGASGEVHIPGTPGGRATYTYTVQLKAGAQDMGPAVTFQFDAFAPQILPVAGVQKIVGDTADVRIKWDSEYPPAQGTDFGSWKVVSKEDGGAPPIAWGPLNAEGAVGRIEVPADAVDGTTYEYRVQLEENGERVGNPTTLTAVVERTNEAFRALDPVWGIPGTQVPVTLTWQNAFRPEEGADLSSWRMVSQSESEGAPEIQWDLITSKNVTGMIDLPENAEGRTYTYLAAAYDGNTQVGGAATIEVIAWTPQFEDVSMYAFAGQDIDISIGWSSTKVPEGIDLSIFTVDAKNESGTAAEWTLSADGLSGTVSIPADMASGSEIVYDLQLMHDSEPAGKPALLTLNVISAQLAEPDPIPAPVGAVTDFELGWAEGAAPKDVPNLDKWTVSSEQAEGPDIAWGPVREDGISGSISIPPTAITGEKYAYTITIASDGTKIGLPVTLNVMVGESVAAPITIDPETLQIFPGAPAQTVIAMENGEAANDGWWSLEHDAPEGTSLESLGVTDAAANPIVIQTTEETPTGVYTLVYNKDTEAGQIVITVRVEGTADALFAPMPDSGLDVREYGEEGELILVGIPISATQHTYTPQMLFDALEVPEGLKLALKDSEGTEADPESAVATGMVLEVSSDGEVLESALTVVDGDVMGSGTISVTQLVHMARAYQGTEPLEGLYAIAGDLTGTGSITLSDLIKEAQTLLQYS